LRPPLQRILYTPKSPVSPCAPLGLQASLAADKMLPSPFLPAPAHLPRQIFSAAASAAAACPAARTADSSSARRRAFRDSWSCLRIWEDAPVPGCPNLDRHCLSHVFERHFVWLVSLNALLLPGTAHVLPWPSGFHGCAWVQQADKLLLLHCNPVQKWFQPLRPPKRGK